MSEILRPTLPVPPLNDAALGAGAEVGDAERRAYLVFLTGPMRAPVAITAAEIEIGRGPAATVLIDEPGVSRTHAFLRRVGAESFVIEDAGSSNGVSVNGVRIDRRAVLREGDRIQLGATVLRLALHDRVDEAHQQALYAAAGVEVDEPPPLSMPPRSVPAWSPDSWRERPVAQGVAYDDQAAFENAVGRVRRLPPLVTSWEVEELKQLLADAQTGARFMLQGGDCAERIEECEPDRIAAKLKILIQMSLVLIRGTRRPIIRVGRFAGQYAKPRSSLTERKGGVELPSYFGDLVNGPEFTPNARRPDPNRLLEGYLHAAVTLNFVRALSAGGFNDLRRPEYFDLSYFERADLPPELSTEYRQICREITDGLTFARAFGDRAADELMKVSFFASHEGLNLPYEHAQTRRVPRREGHYDLTTHLPWIGERTRALDGAHVEFFRGIANPVAVKLGPSVRPDDAVDLCRALNPRNEPGKLVLITRMGLKNVENALAPLLQAVDRARRRVLWVCDPMHGNGMTTADGIKTRSFDDILGEIERTAHVHATTGTYFGGIHFELTGDDVTECVGGGLSEADLSRSYQSLCDPRLNYRQALQMAFRLADVLRRSQQARPSELPPRA